MALAEPNAVVMAIERPHPRLLVLYVLRVLLLCVFGPWFLLALLPLYFRYQTLKFRFDAEGVSMAWGLIWRREIHLTYARIQDIHLSRGLLERWLGARRLARAAALTNASDLPLIWPRADRLARWRVEQSRCCRCSEPAPIAMLRRDPCSGVPSRKRWSWRSRH